MPHNIARPLPGLWHMPTPQWGPGLYWISQQSSKKGVVHHAILDVGNRTGFADTGMWQDMLIHQTPPSIRREPSAGTGQWHLHLRIHDEQGAIERLKLAWASPHYDVVKNNCEHFARFIATGVRESHQLRGACAFALVIGGLVWAAAAAG